MARTIFGKSRKPAEQGGTPYAIYQLPDRTMVQVLKTYKHHDNEDAYARWFTASSGPNTFGSLEMGDAYARDIKAIGRLVSATPEWREAYPQPSNNDQVIEMFRSLGLGA